MIREILVFLPLYTCLGAMEKLFTQPCCPKVQVEGVTYNINNATNRTLSVFCPSPCVYQRSGSNDNSEGYCFDTVNNNSLCMDLDPTPNNDRTGRVLRPTNTIKKKNARGPRSHSQICGHVYHHAYYGDGGYVPVTKANFLNNWKKCISSLKLNPGCKMTLYEKDNFGEPSMTYTNSIHWLGLWNDRARSVFCTCGTGSSIEWEHCTSDFPCGEGRGDCDTDNDCKSGHTCNMNRQNNCRFYHSQAHQYADCCIKEHFAVKKKTLFDICDYSTMMIDQSCTIFQLVDGSLVKDGIYRSGFITSAVTITKNYQCPQIEFLTKLGLMHINSGTNAKTLEAADWVLFGAQASASLNCYEAEAKLELVLTGGSVSIFELQIAMGISSKIGFDEKTHSVEVKYLGDGISLGGRTGFCVFASCFMVNFYKFFGRMHQGSRMLPCQGQCPEVRAEVLEKRCITVSGKNETVCEWVWNQTDMKALIG